MLRIIGKLDVKPPYVVKPVHFEGLRKIGGPAEIAKKWYEQGIDEIIYIDIVASLYQRNLQIELIKETADVVLIPFIVGGGVRTIDDFSTLFHGGADKVSINTHVLQKDPELITQASEYFGAQSVVVNIDAKKLMDGWTCYTDCGRLTTNRDAIEWAKEAEQRGAGEIFLQSVDRDGRRLGFDIDLINEVTAAVDIPVVAASGAGSIDDVVEMAKESAPSGVAISSLLHYESITIKDLKRELKTNGIEVSL